MNWQLTTLVDPVFSGRVCMTLLHSLWQVALLAMVAAAFERLWRRSPVERAYAVHVVALVVAIAAVPFTCHSPTRWSMLVLLSAAGGWMRTQTMWLL